MYHSADCRATTFRQQHRHSVQVGGAKRADEIVGIQIDVGIGYQFDGFAGGLDLVTLYTLGAQVFLGGNDSYVAMCHKCWIDRIREQEDQLTIF